MDHKFSEIDHVTPLFNLFLVVHLPTHSDIIEKDFFEESTFSNEVSVTFFCTKAALLLLLVLQN